MFSKARIRLTAWYAGVLAAFLVLLGTAVYLVERHQLLSNVSHGLQVQAARSQAGFTTGGITSLLAIAASMLMSVGGYLRWHQVQQAMRRSEPLPPARILPFISGGICAAAVVAFVLVALW